MGGSALLAQTVVKAELNGGHVVNSVGEHTVKGTWSAATADVVFNVYPDRIEFSIRLRQFGTDVNQIRVHLGGEGLSGPIILNMYDRRTHGQIAGVGTLAGGVFDGVAVPADAVITDALRLRGIRNFDDVKAALLHPAGLTYTDVSRRAHRLVRFEARTVSL
jgi:hypothetical protein